MSTLYILTVSLYVIPLLGPIILEPVISLNQIWTAKEFYVLIFILLIVMAYLINGRDHKATVNYPLIALMLFLPISVFSAPPLQLIYGHENIAGLWMWRGLAWCFGYFMFYMAICSNPPIRDKLKTMIVMAIGIPAIISAGYAYIQFLNIDQWQITKPMTVIGHILSSDITAMIGNPTYLAVWLVMCLPFLCLFFRWYWVAFVLGAIPLCQSDIGNVGAIVTLIFIALMRAKSTIWLKATIAGTVMVALLICFNWREIRPNVKDNGRFAVWAQTFEDWKSPCIKIEITPDMSVAQKAEIEKWNKKTFSLTGRGIGSFPFIFGVKYTTNYESAHNEYLEGLYSIGLIGMILFFSAIGLVFYHAFPLARNDTLCMALYVSLFFCCFAAAGLPTLHVEPLRFTSAVMFCLLSSMIVRKNNP